VELHELLEREKANEQATLFQHGIGLLLRRARFPVLADARPARMHPTSHLQGAVNQQ
jgi:hypothetical protein